MKKYIALGVLVVVAGAVALNWKTIMTGFMTSSIDASSKATVEMLSGDFELATRYTPGANGEKGNEAPLVLATGVALQTNDKIVSGGNETKIVLALDGENRVELRAADFIVKQLFGDESTRFQANVEEGNLLFDVKARAGRDVAVVDTNKNTIEMTSDAAKYYLAVTSFDGTLHAYVHKGKVRVTNMRKPDAPSVIELGDGEGVEIADDGSFEKVKESDWIASIAW